MLALKLLILAAACWAYRMSEQVPPVVMEQNSTRITISNGFVLFSFNLVNPQVDILRADFEGKGNYSANLFSQGRDQTPLQRAGMVLERDGYVNGKFTTVSSSMGAGPDLRVVNLGSDWQSVTIRIDGIVDDYTSPVVTSSWILQLAAGQRNFGSNVMTQVLSTTQVTSVRVSFYLLPLSVYGQFNRGSVQMLDSDAPYFGSTDEFVRFYALGNVGCVDISVDPFEVAPSYVLLNNPPGLGTLFVSGIQFILAGTFPVLDEWTYETFANATPVTITAGQWMNTSADVGANNLNFPATYVNNNIDMPLDHIIATMAAPYASSAGLLFTYIYPGQSAATLSDPTLIYTNMYNFYDPDSFFSITSMCYSGDAYLINQARTVLERSGAFMLPTGQLPHHFIGTTPTYIAISGATQTGPNLFWISASLEYVKASGNYTWLDSHIDQLEHALSFVTALYNETVQMIRAPGSLYIDVFIRENFTADSNAFLTHVLNEMADVQTMLGNYSQASKHLQMSAAIVEGMNKYLWSTDHYVTQMNLDGSIRDFVDYDANTIAVAFGVAPPERAPLVLARVDNGTCTHPPGGPTYVSEIYYGPTDCFGGNTGDSATAMGRIAWSDGLSRYLMGDAASFSMYQNVILGPVLQQVVELTWLTERYNCTGSRIRSPYYPEYPEMVMMLLREATYGISVGFNNITIDPWAAPPTWIYSFGTFTIDYAPTNVTINIPGQNNRTFTITGMLPDEIYDISVGGIPCSTATSTSSGVLQFSMQLTNFINVCHSGREERVYPN